MIRCIIVTAMLTTVVFAATLAPTDAEGCAAVPRLNEPSISIAEESAIIVWDPVKKVQHFIRRAAFDTKSPDFGFLVPTPTKPEFPFKEVEDAAFQAVDRWMLPKIVDQTKWSFQPLLCVPFFATMSAPLAGRADKSSVRVLHEQKVGGFDVAVLEADNTEDLSNWLKKNGYTNDPELQSWLAPYIGAKWKITAFKIMQAGKDGQLATTKAVRMSFAAEKPFFPYREPEGKPAKQNGEPEKSGRPGQFMSRMLRVYFISDQRMTGKLGDNAWHATTRWSDHVTEEQRTSLAADTGIPTEDLPAKIRMTTFEDSSSPRPGRDEVYFEPSADQTVVRPPDFVRYRDVWIPLDVVIVGIVVLFVVVMGMRYLWKTSRRNV